MAFLFHERKSNRAAGEICCSPGGMQPRFVGRLRNPNSVMDYGSIIG